MKICPGKTTKNQIMRKCVALAMMAFAWGVTAKAAYAVDISESTKVGGTAYFDFTNIDQTTNGNGVTPSGTGIDVKRFYLTLDHVFDSMWTANLTTDFNYVAADSQTQVLVKKAYVQAKVSDAFIARAGAADMPWIPFVEGLYGYRFVENTVADRTKFGTSADWGMHAGGGTSDGMVTYAVSAVNGNGYKNPSRSKSVDFEGRIAYMPMKGVTLAAGLYNGKLGKVTQGVTSQHTAQRYDAVIAYVDPVVRFGVEYFRTTNWTQVLLAPTDSSTGSSTWLSYNITDKTSLFARYDNVSPSKDLNPNYKDRYYNLGLAYHVRANVDVALVYKHEDVTGGALSTASSGTIGSATAPMQGKYDEIGVWAQVKF